MRKTLFQGTLVAVLVIFTLLVGSCKRLHNHSFGDWVYSTEPTCPQTGEKYRECKCGERDTVAVAPLGVHELKNNICTMCGKNLNPYFFNLFKSLISEDYPLIIKDLSLNSQDKTAHYSFKNTELIVSASGDELSMQLTGTCEVTKSNVTRGYSFVGVLDDEALYAKLITEYEDDSTLNHYLALPLSAVEINSELSSLADNLRRNALLKHSSTLSLLVDSIIEWRKNAIPEIISFCESHFEEIAPFLNDYFTSLFKVTMIDDRVGLELNFSKIKEFNNTLYNEKIGTLYEQIAKEPFDRVEGKITGIMNTTVGELLRLAEEENLDINATIQYCFTTLYNLRVISSSEIPDSIAEKLNDEYAKRTLLSIIAQQLDMNENEVLKEIKSALSKISELTGYQYIYKLAEGNNYDKPTSDEDAALRDRWTSINSRLVSFSSFAITSFVTDPDGEMYSFKMTFRVGASTINIRLDKEYVKTVIPSATMEEIKETTNTPSREELISLLPSINGASVDNDILTLIPEIVNEDLQNVRHIKNFNLNECIIIYSPISENAIRVTLLGALCELGENGEILDTGMDLTSLTVIYYQSTGTITPENISSGGK